MEWFLLIAALILLVFAMGYDYSSYIMMRRVDRFYKKRNKWILGYNTYKVWKINRTSSED